MTSPELSARLRYLNDSAHLFATTAPETSRHLMSRRNALMFDSQIEQSDAQNRTSCGACGTIMLAGWEGTLKSQSARSRPSKAEKLSYRPVQSRVIVYECETCGRKTQERVKVSSPIKRHSGPASLFRQADQMGTPANPLTNPPSTSSSSKRRAKSRKGGLAAILAQKNTTSTSKSGFDLMDFMKKA